MTGADTELVKEGDMADTGTPSGSAETVKTWGRRKPKKKPKRS